MATLEERLARISSRAECERRIREDEKRMTIHNNIFAKRDCEALAPRARDLCKCAQQCIDEGIPFDEKYFAVNHEQSIGFITTDRLSNNIFAIGIITSCADIHLSISSGEIYFHGGHDEEVDAYLMRIFLDQFERFETSFYKYIDSL